MTEMFDQQITERLQRSGAAASFSRPSFGDVRKRVRARRRRNLAVIATPGVLAVAALGMRTTGTGSESGGPAGAAPGGPVSSQAPVTTLPSLVASQTPVPETVSSPAPVTTIPYPSPAHEEAVWRVGLATPALAALGFPDIDVETAADAVTTITATDPTRPAERTIKVVMTPGTVLQPENDTPVPVEVVEQTDSLIRVENRSNTGWIFSVEFVDTGAGEVLSLAELQEFIYSIDP